MMQHVGCMLHHQMRGNKRNQWLGMWVACRVIEWGKKLTTWHVGCTPHCHEKKNTDDVACGLHAVSSNESKRETKTNDAACGLHATSLNEKGTDDTACGLHTALLNENEKKETDDMACGLHVTSSSSPPPPAPFYPPSPPSFGPPDMCCICWGCWWWLGGRWKVRGWAMDILALWSLSLHWIGPDWAFSRPLSGGSGWPRSGGGGVRKGRQHCCVGKLMSEVEMTWHNFADRSQAVWKKNTNFS